MIKNLLKFVLVVIGVVFIAAYSANYGYNKCLHEVNKQLGKDSTKITLKHK